MKHVIQSSESLGAFCSLGRDWGHNRNCLLTGLVIAHLWPMKELTLSDLRNLVLLLLQRSKPHDTISGGFGGLLAAPSRDGTPQPRPLIFHFSKLRNEGRQRGERGPKNGAWASWTRLEAKIQVKLIAEKERGKGIFWLKYLHQLLCNNPDSYFQTDIKINVAININTTEQEMDSHPKKNKLQACQDKLNVVHTMTKNSIYNRNRISLETY